jgi:hypothetical protein
MVGLNNEEKKLYVLYKAGALKWNRYGTYNSKQEMIDSLINDFGVYDLEGCDENEIEEILEDWEFKFEII